MLFETRPKRLAALAGIFAALFVAGVPQADRPPVAEPPAAQQDDDRAQEILRELDQMIAAEKATHTAPKLGYTLEPARVLARTDEMVRLDQLIRTFEVPRDLPLPVWRKVRRGIGERMVAHDKLHTRELRRWVRRNEWPKLSRFGPRTSHNAWLLAQHADHDRDFQRVVLEQMRHLLPLGEVDPKHLAYLHDRVAVGADELQRFATQGRCMSPREWRPWPYEDPPGVDQRRAAMGLEPLEDYKDRLDAICARFFRPRQG